MRSDILEVNIRKFAYDNEIVLKNFKNYKVNVLFSEIIMIAMDNMKEIVSADELQIEIPMIILLLKNGRSIEVSYNMKVEDKLSFCRRHYDYLIEQWRNWKDGFINNLNE
jgi:hypothetical protein